MPNKSSSIPDVVHSDHPLNRKARLLQMIEARLSEVRAAKATKAKKAKPRPATRAEIHRANSRNSTGARTPEGKARVSANSLKHGFFARVEKLNPHDSELYQETYSDLRMGLQPDGPVEEHLIRELATFSARLQRLEAAEYALLLGNIENDPSDCRELAAAFQNTAPQLEQLQKAEVHLRRAYNRTWDRLERMQKERLKMPLDQALKQSQRWLNYEKEKNSPEPESIHQPSAAPPPVQPDPHPASNPAESGPSTEAHHSKSPKSEELDPTELLSR